MKVITWNINGIRAACKKGFLEYLQQEQPDMLCVQEIKAQEDQLTEDILQPEGYHAYWHPAERKGYSGVATFSKKKVKRVEKGFGVGRFDIEGRVILTEHPRFLLLNVYFPNGTSGDERLQYKLDFYDALLDYCLNLQKEGHELIVCGDYNTAHHEIDLARPKANVNTSGFLPIERESLQKWIDNGFTDIFRHFNPEPDHYSWWSYRTNARANNVGWRIDYHMVTQGLLKHCKTSSLQMDQMGSDHCPVVLEIK